MRRPTRAELRVCVWTVQALFRTQLQVRRVSIERVMVRRPRRASAEQTWVVERVARTLRMPCLSTALVRQRWYAALGSDRDVVIGVTRPGQGFRSHAWLDGDRVAAELTELRRQPVSR